MHPRFSAERSQERTHHTWLICKYIRSLDSCIRYSWKIEYVLLVALVLAKSHTNVTMNHCHNGLQTGINCQDVFYKPYGSYNCDEVVKPVQDGMYRLDNIIKAVQVEL